MRMSVRDQLLSAFAALAPQIDVTKALLELNPSAVAISRLLSESHGLILVEYIIDKLECGKKPLYLMNKFVERAIFQKLIEQYYLTQDHKILSILLSCYDQFWVNVLESPGELYQTIKKLEFSDAVNSRELVLNLCLDCGSMLAEASNICDGCGRNDLLNIYSLSLTIAARDVLKNNNYLEIYVKACLKESGIELIGCEFKSLQDPLGKPLPRDAEKQSSGQTFNVKNIRTLLIEGFTDLELRRLCYDESDFRPAYEQLAQGMGKDIIIDKLIEYAERKELMKTLLAMVKEHNPAKYEKYQPYHIISSSSTLTSSVPVQSQGVNFDGSTTKAYTRIKYQVDGAPVEIDVHGISQTSAVLLCEINTSQKISDDEIRRVEGMFDRLIQKLHDFAAIKKIPHLKLFIITGELDQNIPKALYRRNNWELIERPLIKDLVEEFKRIKNEL